MNKRLLHRRLGFLFLLLLFQILGVDNNLFSQNNGSEKENPYHRSMEAVKICKSPEIDGILDDPAWQQVEFHGDFLQREPNEGEPATEKTEIAILYDEENLYIGARCYDSEPDKIRATEMRRDAFLYKDDYLSVIFDTFHDHRNAFFFTTNPFGLRRDGTVSDEGRIQNTDWDGVWHCKTSKDKRGWYLEMAIPWQTLRFEEGKNTVWGANFVRHIQRKNEDDYWRLVSRDAGWYGRYRMSKAGVVRGFRGLKMGGNFELKPYTTGGLQHDQFTDYKTKTLGDVGADLKINLTANLTADITYNTDFAQVEADQERVNLTRFSLFFPEKRDFFLEGAETFTFGQTSGHHFRPRPGNIQLFHSRRIGLVNRQPIPIIGGARLNGKIDKYTLGVLSIQTQAATIDDGDTDQYVPETNFSVFRLKRNLFSRSSAGVMLLNKQEGDGSFNRSLGIDSDFPVNENLRFFMAGAGTYSSGNEQHHSNNLAANMGFSWESDLWDFSSSFLDIQSNFNPEMGFIRRTDIRRTKAEVSYSPRPKSISSIRQFDFGIKGEYQTDHQNYLLNRRINGEFDIRFENSAHLSFDVVQEYEYLDYDWEVREGFLIPQDGYTNTQYRARFSTNRTHDITARVNVNIGQYFTGTRTGGGLSTDVIAMDRLNGSIDFGYNRIKLPEGSFNTTTASTRIIYSFSPDLYVKAFLQWYDDKLLNDGKSLFSGNIILRYIYQPGSNFYLVFNQQNLIGPGKDILRNRTLQAKLTYFFRR